MGVLLGVAALAAQIGATAARAADLGPIGSEGPIMREQVWLVAGADQRVPLRATVFRPSRVSSEPAQRSPLVVINHGTDASTRTTMGRPVFLSLSRWFVDRGFVVVLPQRRGHGTTGGPFVEGFDRCGATDHFGRGLAAAADIEAAIRYMAAQDFVDGRFVVVAGTSTGGWASLALASRNVAGVRLIVNFAGGRGGHAYGKRNIVCQPDRLVDAAGHYARTARVPTVWFYAHNDSYFDPGLAMSLARAWEAHGGRVALKLLPEVGMEGHFIMSDSSSRHYWERDLAKQLAALDIDPAHQVASHSADAPQPSLTSSADIMARAPVLPGAAPAP
jgi:dienelactone hydrolase